MSGWILSLMPPVLPAFLFFMSAGSSCASSSTTRSGCGWCSLRSRLQLTGTLHHLAPGEDRVLSMDLQSLPSSSCCSSRWPALPERRSGTLTEPAVDAPAPVPGRRHAGAERPRLRSAPSWRPAECAGQARPVARAEVAEEDEPRPADDGIGRVSRRLAGHPLRRRFSWRCRVIVFVGGAAFYGRGTPMIFAGCRALPSPTICRISGWAAGSRVAAREIRNGLPDAIDLLIVCIEAGSGIDQAHGPGRRRTAASPTRP